MNKKIFLAIGLMTLIVACKSNKEQKNEETTAQTEAVVANDDEKMVIVELQSKNDSGATGTVTFTQKDGIVYMELKGEGFTPGEHAIHIHEFADCSSADGKSSGGHWNPTGEDHGKWGTHPYHKGDIGNFTADADGKVFFQFQTDEWSIGGDDETKNILGHAIIIHDGVDDFTSQPTGNAGSRICCGEIK